MTQTMIELSDEVLCAYLDNELDATQRAQVEQALAADAGASVRLARMREADGLLQQALPVTAVNQNDPLVALIRGDAAAAPVSAPSRRPYLWAIAASVVGLMVGVLLAQRVGGGDAGSANFAIADAATRTLMLDALDHAASGSQLQRDAAQVQMVLSFNAQDGRVCRVLNAANRTQQLEAVACQQQGQWQLIALDAAASGANQFKAAGASELVDSVMSRLGATAALEPEQEQALLKRDWR